jgi:hypothetical protein
LVSLSRPFHGHRASSRKMWGTTCGYLARRISSGLRTKSFNFSRLLAGDRKPQRLWDGISSALKEAFQHENVIWTSDNPFANNLLCWRFHIDQGWLF